MTDVFGEWLNSLQSGVTDEVWTAAGPVTSTPIPPAGNGVYYCGGQVWTPDLYPMLPDRWEPHDVPVAERLIEPSSDSAHPDTSQPYFLDLIARIDELT